jgi:hypothetical protein
VKAKKRLRFAFSREAKKLPENGPFFLSISEKALRPIDHSSVLTPYVNPSAF